METVKYFQGVVCCNLDNKNNKQAQDDIKKLLDLKSSSVHQNITCSNLELKNKYYKTIIHLFDYNDLTELNQTQFLESCYGIILYTNTQRITTDRLDEKVEQLSYVGGEPRILLCDGIAKELELYRILLDWCIKNGYAFIDAGDETAQRQLIDSLSAYKWKHRLNETDPGNKTELDDELIKKLMDFDSLLGKMSAYRDRPELRGNPDDKNIVEIAEILSGLLGEDVDSFLGSEDGVNDSV